MMTPKESLTQYLNQIGLVIYGKDESDLRKKWDTFRIQIVLSHDFFKVYFDTEDKDGNFFETFYASKRIAYSDWGEALEGINRAVKEKMR